MKITGFKNNGKRRVESRTNRLAEDSPRVFWSRLRELLLQAPNHADLVNDL